MSDSDIQSGLGKGQKIAWTIGVAGVVAVVAGYMGVGGGRETFSASYLMAFWYWFCFAAGSLGLLLIHHLVGGHWGFVIQRPLEAAARTIPFMAVLFVPIVLGMHDLYKWTHEAEKADPIVSKKLAYLNEPGFIMRAAIFFACWTILAYLLSNWSRKQDAESDPSRTNEKIRLLAGPGLVIYVLCMTFAGIDWGMSLTPHWFSTMYGPLFMVGAGLNTFALMAIVANRFQQRAPFHHALGQQQFHDIGNMMFAFTILWSYMSISEYVIIWSGNLYEETEWFIHRAHGGWKSISIALAIGQFAIPFLLLLNKSMKRHGHLLAKIAIWVLAFRYLGVFWLVAPCFRDHLAFHWMDAATVVAVGGIWVGLFLGQLRKMQLLPMGDPRFKAKLEAAKGGHG